MAQSIRPGDVLAGRYRLIDLLSESGGGRFWRAHDRVLERHVALHVIAEHDERAPALIAAARSSATVPDRRVLRVLDAERLDGLCYVVNEWGTGTSLDVLVTAEGPLPPRRAAWLVAEVADTVARAHHSGTAHGRLVPENVLIDRTGGIRVIGLAVDAALHGLPLDRREDDVADLAGLLYCALTGKWAGRTPSGVPAAPRHHGRVLRPRQVRAGVPRPLDALCDHLLNPAGSRHHHGDVPQTARGIADMLAEFVGDPTGLAEQLALADAHRGQETVTLPPVPEIPVRPHGPATGESEAITDATLGVPTPVPLPQPPAGPDAGPRTDDDAPAPEGPGERADAEDGDELTQPGMPVFAEEPDEPAWYEPSGEAAPPPPPFEDPPERPLFAPTPPEGTPARRPRHGSRPARTGDEYWPWSEGGSGRPAAGPPAPPPAEGDEEAVPGRRWLRLALALGAALLLLMAIVVAVNLSRGKTPLGDEPDEPSASPSRTAGALRPMRGLSATDLDPEGGADGENPETVGRVVDRDPATTWRTMTYLQQFGPGGLKAGVGTVIDLGEPTEVAGVDLAMVGEPTDVEFYLTDTAPENVEGLDPVATRTVDSEARVRLREPVRARYLTVWLTSLPQILDGFRGEIAEITVLR